MSILGPAALQESTTALRRECSPRRLAHPELARITPTGGVDGRSSQEDLDRIEAHERGELVSPKSYTLPKDWPWQI